MMSLYKISQTYNNAYDSYDSAVVRAETYDEARAMDPTMEPGANHSYRMESWAPVEEVTVEWLGVACHGSEAGVVVASFNAG